MSLARTAQQTDLQGPRTESMIMDPLCDAKWGARPVLHNCTTKPGPVSHTYMQEAHAAGLQLQ